MMNNSTVQLLDLPDEMLIQILNKLNNVDVLYSVLGVNKRLNRLACDPIFTNYLDLTTKISKYDERCSMSNVRLDQFCSFILLKIHHNIECLVLESSSMERILLTCDYPKLNKLILYSIKPELFLNYLSNDSSIAFIFKQITHLEVITIEYGNTNSQFNLNMNAYECLFSVCQRLTHLNINAKCYRRQQCAFPSANCSSSILIELDVNVDTIDDCLRLLDGRFNQMKSFIVKIDSIDAPLLNIDNKINLLNLTTFFLSCSQPTEAYDEVILPLLRRMTNMEKLTLVLFVENRPDFIDGAHLYKEILVYMPRRIHFMFNIITINDRVDISYWLKEDDIQTRYIIDDGEPYIYCCIDYFTNGIGRCRISTLPCIQSHH
ncbi:unnamed protein product [Adineta steineri]|uniref:F-box domain-containing protein n=1 Tax=Adineta steineri TaxID=433720 RepID=A0A814DC40_9BILA|nr:unnamed protein product [Adineta steineri]CAF1191268.1 unnamed protein product [Adineta steineri]